MNDSNFNGGSPAYPQSLYQSAEQRSSPAWLAMIIIYLYFQAEKVKSSALKMCDHRDHDDHDDYHDDDDDHVHH